MKTFKKQAAQGDMLINRIDDSEVPAAAKEISPEGNRLIVAHSETGHHHWINKAEARFYGVDNDPMVCFLRIDGDHADLFHERSFDTHETLRLPKGTYRINRQREYTPQGWRRIED